MELRPEMLWILVLIPGVYGVVWVVTRQAEQGRLQPPPRVLRQDARRRTRSEKGQKAPRGELPGWAKLVGLLGGLAAAILLTWWTIVAFVGGTLWPTGIEVEGGLVFGIVWLLFIDPVAATILYWTFALVMLPITGAASVTKRWR